MVKYQRKNLCNQWKKGKDFAFDEDEESGLYPFGFVCENSKRIAKPKFYYFVFLSLASCCLILSPLFLFSSSSFSLLYSFGGDTSDAAANGFLCSSVPNGTICCDRRSIRTDVCVMKGDVRTHSVSSSIMLYPGHEEGDEGYEPEPVQHEKIKPYTRKWEKSVMDTIDEITLVTKQGPPLDHRCDVHHDVPAVFFSTGGYTGNLYHEFNDGIIPLYITSQKLNKKVVFVMLEYHNWWITKYGDVLSQLSDFPAVDFTGDKRVHCFPEAIVGLQIHNELTIDASLMEGEKTIQDFHDLLDRAYWPRIKSLIEDEERDKSVISPSSVNDTSINPIQGKVGSGHKPKLVIISRNGSRAITNEDLVVKLAEMIGFEVEILKPERTTELAKIYRVLNSSDVMLGTHGAAMTHFLFMKPGSVFIQVVPLGTDWAAETYYGEPATKLGLNYMGYNILPKESSLYDEYDQNDPILMDPKSVNKKGWEFTKKVYLDRQTVRLDLRRFSKRLVRAHRYVVARNRGRFRHYSE